MLIFSNPRGNVTEVVPTPTGEIASFIFPDFTYEALYSIITSNQLKFSANHQAMDTIGGNVYLTSFGEAMTPVGYSGYLFSNVCDDFTERTGPERLMNWWQTENLSNRRPPVYITYGFNTVIRGFVVGLDIAAQNARDRVWNFNLILLKIPFRAEIDESRFAEASADVPSSGTEEPASQSGDISISEGGLQPTPGSQYAYQKSLKRDRLDYPVTYNAALSGQLTPRVLSDPLA